MKKSKKTNLLIIKNNYTKIDNSRYLLPLKNREEESLDIMKTA